METIQFEKYKKALSQYNGNPFDESLLMTKEGSLEIYFSPFEHVNVAAQIVLVGISPGATQAHNANEKASALIRAGVKSDEVSEKAKLTGAFSGALRKNLVKMLDYIEVNKRLGIQSCESLFNEKKDLLHSTSAFRYPTLLNGKPISSAKSGLKTSVLKNLVETCLADEIESLPSTALYIPMGQGVENMLLHLSDKGILQRHQLLIGLPHPSGANAERISYFLGNKAKEMLSAKTNADKIDSAKKQLQEQLSAL
jgi:hypothetical protein